MEQKWEPSDHDLLVELKTLVQVVRDDLRSTGEQLRQIYATMDARVRVLEAHMARFPADRYEKALEEWQEFRGRLHVYAIMLTTVASVVASLLSALIRISVR